MPMSTPEQRREILEMFKKTNNKYAKVRLRQAGHGLNDGRRLGAIGLVGEAVPS